MIAVSVIIIIIVIALVIRAFRPRQIDSLLESRYLLALGAIVLALTVTMGRFSLRMALFGDEIEHIHSGWYVDQGKIPFTDFFQHHHPTFWYAMIPIFKVFGHTVNAIRALRVTMLLQVLAIAWFTWRIAIVSTNSREIGAIAVITLLSLIMFLKKGLEIRPDVPQTLAGMISIYYLLIFLRDGRRRYLVWCSLALSISFVFLQKAALLIAVYGILFVWLLYKRRLGWKDLVVFGSIFTLPLLAGVAWLVYTGSWNDYVLTNWKLNLNFARSKPAWLAMQFTLFENTIFWLLAACSSIYILLRKDIPGSIKIVTFLGLALYVPLYGLKRVHAQYFLPALPLLCVTAAAGMTWLFERLRLNAFYKIVLVLLVISQPASYMNSYKHNFGGNRSHLRAIKFVLENTQPTDCVYDGMPKFNVFRPDIHYFWYSIKDERGLGTYNQLTNNRFGELDLPALIREKKPRIISDFLFNLKEAGLKDEYRKTKYDRVFIRADQP